MDDRTPSASSAPPTATIAAPENTTAPTATEPPVAAPAAPLAPGVPTADPSVVHTAADGGAQPAWAGSAAVLTAGNRTRLVLAGEVDASMNEELATCTTEIMRSGGPLDVDVRNVSFMDSSVLAVIARLTQRLGEPVRVIGPSESVRFLLDLTHLSEVVEIHDADPEAGLVGDEAQEPGSSA